MIKISDKIVIYDTPELLEICGRELTASEIIPYIGSRKKLRILADRFHLNGVLSVPGGDVLLAARHISSDDGFGIDVNGVNGRDAPASPKPKPATADAPAPNGEDGPELGGNAGKITVFAQRVEGKVGLTANGGRGSKGQPGGNAADGKHGTPDRKKDHRGGPGGSAGPIGIAGMSRNSGNGGTIEYFIEDGAEMLVCSANGGPEVPAATHGKPGLPGKGGKGGKEWKCIDRVGRHEVYTVGILHGGGITCGPTGKFKADGPDGAPSPAIKTSPVAGLAGQDGTVKRGEPFEIGVDIPLRGLRLLMIEAEILHIQAMASDEAAQEAVRSAMQMAGFVFMASMGNAKPSIAEIASRASALMHRILSASPPEGTRGLEVSLTPLPQLLDALKAMLESRWRGSFYIEALKSDTRSEEQVSAAITEIRSQAMSIQSEGDGRLRELAERRDAIIKTIDDLSSNFRIVWKEVQKADEDFRAEVARENPCADFLNVVIAVATVAVTVISAGSAAAGAIAAGSEFLAYIDKDETRKTAYEAEIKKAGGLKTRLDGYAKGAQDLADNAARLKEFLGGDALTPPEDHVRVAMTREDFNKMIEPYRGMDATEELKSRMDRFFSLTETRNSLLLEHDQIVIETASIIARTESAQRQVDDLIGKEGAALIDTSIDAYEAAMWIDLEAGKRLMGMLQTANKSYEYLALHPRPMKLTTTRGDNLEDEFRMLVSDVALRLRPDELHRDAICEITISKATHPETFAALAKDGNAVVSLMPEHVPPAQKDRWDERAYSVGVKISGIKVSSRNAVALRGNMVSCGIAWFRKRDGEPVSMRIPMRDAVDVAVSTTLDLDEVRASRNLIGTEIYTVDASPYGLWRISIPGIDTLMKDKNGKIDAKILERISLTFCFVGTTRISHKYAALIDARRADLLPLLSRPKLDPMLLSADVDETAELVEEERESEVSDLHRICTGSSVEGAMLLRTVEDMLHVRTLYSKVPITADTSEQQVRK